MNWFAYRDVKEVNHSDLMLLDTWDESPRGGREFEFGYAYQMGIPVWVVGPMRNVFHRLADIRFAEWWEVIQVLEERTYALHNERNPHVRNDS